MKMHYIFLLSLFISHFMSPQWAFAYIGPGAGISAIGTVVAFIGAVLLAIVGFVWYPVKRLLAGRKRKKSNEQENKAS